ncbi:MAG TPA: ATP-dependent helicase, partial [Dehalococcoidia bacterium]|nr:ATP-dependent helicase [Dehalococcoidia bacterium]
PFRKYGGLRFLEAAHIKDLVSFLRVLENPRDEIAWFRILQLLNGLGPATAASIVEHLGRSQFSLPALAAFKAPVAAQAELAALGSLLTELADMGDQSPSVQIDRICRLYTPLLQRNYENPEPRANDIEYLSVLAAGYESRRQFLADLVLDPPVSTGDLAGPPSRDEDWLVLSTIHSAKGLEWDVVYLIHAADGCLPSDMSTGDDRQIEEELRLTYVAMTRARDFLYVLWPQRYYHRSFGLSDRHSYAQCCRFITDAVLKTMDRISLGKKVGHADAPVQAGAGEDIGARIRDLWK